MCQCTGEIEAHVSAEGSVGDSTGWNSHLPAGWSCCQPASPLHLLTLKAHLSTQQLLISWGGAPVLTSNLAAS